jgi:hypothetical protein
METDMVENKVVKTDREIVTRILGLSPENIEYLHSKCGMPFDDEGFSDWFVANAALVLEELKQHQEELLFPGKFRPEPSKTPA